MSFFLSLAIVLECILCVNFFSIGLIACLWPICILLTFSSPNIHLFDDENRKPLIRNDFFLFTSILSLHNFNYPKYLHYNKKVQHKINSRPILSISRHILLFFMPILILLWSTNENLIKICWNPITTSIKYHRDDFIFYEISYNMTQRLGASEKCRKFT